MTITASPITVFVAAFCVLFVLGACESHQQKEDDAFNRVKAEKMLKSDTNTVIKAVDLGAKKPESLKTLEYEDGWDKFKNEIEKKIRANESTIKAIKIVPNTSATVLKKIARLEQDNNDLRKKMDLFKEEATLKLENFKALINHDVNEIGISVKDLETKNKK